MSHTLLIVSGDVVYDVGGRPTMVEGKAKVGQDLGEATVVPVDDIGFGFGILELVGRVEDPISVPGFLDSAISRGLKRFIALQQNQQLIRTNDELISTIRSVQAKLNDSSKTDYSYSFSVNTVSQDTIKKSGGVG